jgi:hypothetical protein
VCCSDTRGSGDQGGGRDGRCRERRVRTIAGHDARRRRGRTALDDGRRCQQNHCGRTNHTGHDIASFHTSPLSAAIGAPNPRVDPGADNRLRLGRSAGSSLRSHRFRQSAAPVAAGSRAVPSRFQGAQERWAQELFRFDHAVVDGRHDVCSTPIRAEFRWTTTAGPGAAPSPATLSAHESLASAAAIAADGVARGLPDHRREVGLRLVEPIGLFGLAILSYQVDVATREAVTPATPPTDTAG